MAKVRPIYDLSLNALQSLVRDINDALEQAGAGDNRGQRSANAAPGVQPSDLVTKAQLDVILDRVRAVEALPRQKARVVTVSTTASGGLPKADHYIDFSYYFGKQYQNEYKSWTTCYWAGVGEDGDDEEPPVWKPKLTERLLRAVADGKEIIIEFEYSVPKWGFEPTMEAIEDAGFSTVWPHIRMFLFSDEPGVPLATFEDWISSIRDIVRSYNLTCPPLGCAFTKKQIEQGTLLKANGLDYVGIEGYVDPPGNSTSSVNVEYLTNWLKQAKSLVPASKKIFFVMQAYNRNGVWVNEKTLLDLQAPVYLAAWNDPRVTAILMFAWYRPGTVGTLISKGTRELGATFQNEHKRIYAALSGQAIPQTDGCSKLSTGAFLQETWFDAFDLCIIENFPALFYNPGDGTYVIAGQEAAARDALLEVLNRDQYPVQAIAATPVPPYGEYDILMKPQDSDDFSELFTPFASSGKCRLAGGYIETCRPAKF